MTLENTLNKTNNALFSSKMANIIQYMYEDELQAKIAKVFHKMRVEILKNLDEYYNTEVMLNAHADLILAPIHEHHKAYYETIMRYKFREFNKGKVQGKRLVTRAKKYAINYAKMHGAIKADTTNIPLSSLIKKDELFATSEFSSDIMRDKTFVASENTLARVDSDINQIITKGYEGGMGIKDVANSIEKRFDQLETWEARRIARTEIHGSHMQGVMKSYEDMGVEYTQWASAHDTRVRGLKPSDKADHVKMDGEIIPWGGTFSNGLHHPGDTSGPIYEWINCRCGCLPWFCPPGFMVPPGVSNFRESDLIATLDKWSNEQLLTNMNEAQESTYVPQLSQEEERKMKDWYDMYHRVEQHESHESFYENTLKNRYLKAVEANVYHTEELTSRMLTEIKALEKYYPEQYNRMVKEITKEVDYNRLSPAQQARLKELKKIKNEDPAYWKMIKEGVIDELMEFERIAKDTNIRAEEVILDLHDSTLSKSHGFGSSYHNAGSEAFIKYNFKDKDYSIYISKNFDDIWDFDYWQDVSTIRKLMSEQPSIIEDSYKKICVSGQSGIKRIKTGRGVGGWSNTKGDVVIFKCSSQRFESTVSHEGAHNLETELYKITNDPEYINVTEKDMKLRRDGKIEMTELPKELGLNGQADDRIWISNYAEEKSTETVNPYVEDWADSVAAYVQAPEWLKHNYPNRYKYIDDMFKKYGDVQDNTLWSRLKRFIKR